MQLLAFFPHTQHALPVGAQQAKGIVLACQAYVDRSCQHALSGPACQADQGRLTRLRRACMCPAAWCDADVESICSQAAATPRNRGVWSIGAVGRCLSRQLAESKPLTTDCRRLVLAAAPKVGPLPQPPLPARNRPGCSAQLARLLLASPCSQDKHEMPLSGCAAAEAPGLGASQGGDAWQGPGSLHVVQGAHLPATGLPHGCRARHLRQGCLCCRMRRPCSTAA